MSTTTEPTPEVEPSSVPPDVTEPKEKKARRFPTAFTVLAALLLIVWGASFIIPSGVYDQLPDGGPKPGTYHEIPSCSEATGDELCVDKSIGAQLKELWIAPSNGLYGIENERGKVGPWESGSLYGSAQIFLFVLAVGAFITVTMKTEAIQTGIGRLAVRYRKSGGILIAVLMSIFALGGTTYGMWEETLGFFALLVPLVLALGYDRMVAVAIVFFGAGTGVVASTVNPFATGVASDAAGIAVGDGIVVRVVLLLVLCPLAIGYVVRYARKVAKDPSKSIVGISPDDAAQKRDLVDEVPLLTTAQKWILTVFFLAFAILIYGFVPWNDVMDTIFGTEWPLPTFSDFYFAEASVVFLVFAVIIGLIGKLGEKGTVDAIVTGAGDFLGAALVIVLARAVTVVMKNSYITDTILSWTEDAVSGTSAAVFGPVAMIVNTLIAFLVPSSSGHAALIMPILAPLADFAEIPRHIAVTAYQTASGITNYIAPTAAVVMGGLTLAKVGYDKYLRFALPFVAMVAVVCGVVLSVAAVLA